MLTKETTMPGEMALPILTGRKMATALFTLVTYSKIHVLNRFQISASAKTIELRQANYHDESEEVTFVSPFY